MMKNNLLIDCFAGGGGTSVGIEMALGRQVDIAINHDPHAIIMHKANHPDTLHLTEDIFAVDLPKYVGNRHVALMWASPDCRSFSKAKGGQPRSKSVRMLPWAVYKHASVLKPDIIIMENVEEIQQWGPLDKNGCPIKEKTGEEYQRFIHAMCSLGYKFESRELVAADYGAPTTRKRWYGIFRCDGKDIIWPKQTHSRAPEGLIQPWKPCGQYIDWSDLGKSILGRTKPLADATEKRIRAGVEKYIINASSPYIVTDKRALDYAREHTKAPFMAEYSMAACFLTKYYKTGIGQSLAEPCHTITTSPGHFGLVTAFLIKYYGTGGGQGLTEPLATITTKDRFGLVGALLEYDGEKYIIADIFLRMLKPHELMLMQGFPEDYIIDHDEHGNMIPKTDRVKRIGNSVVPIMAKALVSANCGYLKIGERRAKTA